MAKELSGFYTPGTTGIYAILRKNGQTYNGSGYEDELTANWGTYDIPLTETDTTGLYAANMPAAQPAGDYEYILYLEVSPGTPAPTDYRISGVGAFSWDGSAIINERSIIADLTVIKGAGFSATTDTLEKLYEAISAGGADLLENQVPGNYASGSAGHALGRIGTGRISVVSRVELSGDITLTQGDDYNATDGTAIEWTVDEANGWPDLTGATITFSLEDGLLSATGEVVTPTGNQKVRLELTSAQTASIDAGVYTFSVRATLASGRKTTIIPNRKCTVYDDEGL